MNNIIKTLHFVPDVSTEHSLSQRNFFIAMTIVMETHNSRITLQYKWRHNVWRKKNVIVNGYLQTLESVV